MSKCRRAVPGQDDEYAGVARVYDLLIEPFLRRMRRALAGRVERSGCVSILDVACGTGMQLALLEGLPLARTGIDASLAMLRVARARTSPDIAYVHGDASNMPFADNSFGCACVSFALHEMEPEVSARVVREMARVTASGGRLFIADYARPESAWARMALAAAGLVERGAGARHHACFQRFMARRGVAGLVEPLGLEAERMDGVLMGAAGLFEVRIA